MSREEIPAGVVADGDTKEENRAPESFEASVDFSVSIPAPDTEQVDKKGVCLDSNATLMERKRSVDAFFGPPPARWCQNSIRERRGSIGNKKFVFIDLSGTLHVDMLATRQAVEALKMLRVAGFKVLFLTNTTRESRSRIYKRLIEIGFSLNLEEIYTSLNASRRYLEENNLRPFFMVADEAMEDFQGIPTNNPNAVLIGLSSSHFNYETMNEAWRLLSLPDTQLLAIHKGRDLKVSDGWNIGPGAFVYALETASQKKAIVLGKPEKEFFESAMRYVGCEDVMDAVMIGDDVRDDVLGAQSIGMTGIWVQTGKTSGLGKINPDELDFAVPDFADAVALILDKSSDTTPFAGSSTDFRVMADGLKYTHSKSDNFLSLD